VTVAVPDSVRRVTVLEHIYGIPSDEELAKLVGAAVPHFALQIRGRVAEYAAALPDNHPRQPELARQMARLEQLATGGEVGSGRTSLPPRASLQPGNAPS